MKFLDNFRYETNPELSVFAADLLNDKKWRVRNSLWVAMPIFFILGLLSWAFLLFQGLRYDSRLAKSLGVAHLFLFFIAMISGDGLIAGGITTLTVVTGIAFPLYARRDVLIKRAQKKHISGSWLAENAPEAKVGLDQSLTSVKQVVADTKAEIASELEALKSEVDASKEKAERELEARKTAAKVLRQEIETRKAAAKDAELASNDLRADGRTKGPRKLDF